VRSGLLLSPFRLGLSTQRRIGQLAELSLRLRRRVAPGPHWYLSGLGVEPARQRRGIASQLLAPVLRRADRDGRPCYLETSNPGTLALYERLGFRVRDTGAVPLGGPTVWALLRLPGSASGADRRSVRCRG
jgi:ribosomal protein S18 acetylase RimI-like enzyme